MDKIAITQEDAESILQKFWHLSLNDKVQELNSYKDRVFLVSSSKGDKYILKLSAACDIQKDWLPVQFDVMGHLTTQGFTVPIVKPNISGDQYIKFVSAGGVECLGYLLTYIPGELWKFASSLSEQHLYELGRLVAELTISLKSFSHPDLDCLDPDDRWAIHNLHKLVNDLHTLPAERRDLVNAVVTLFQAEVQPMMHHLSKGVIHSDIHDENLILVNDCDRSEGHAEFQSSCQTDKAKEGADAECGTEETKIKVKKTVSSKSVKFKYGIIDFGDLMYSCTIFELATAVAYVMMQEDTNGDEYLKRGKIVIQGYLSESNMILQERKAMFFSVCGRYCIELVNGHVTMLNQGNDEGHNLNPCEKEGWKQLTNLMELGSSKLYDYWFNENPR